MLNALDASELASQLPDCAARIDAWPGLLATLCAASGATHALLSLRDEDARLVMREDGTFDPVMHGFTAAHAGEYAMHYAAIDPWCEVAVHEHPQRPVLASDHLPPDRLATFPFGRWIGALGIVDTVVMDVGDADEGWIALNLYFPAVPVNRAALLERLEALQPLLRRTLDLARDAASAERRLAQAASDRADIAAIVSGDGTVLFGANHLVRCGIAVVAGRVVGSGPAQLVARYGGTRIEQPGALAGEVDVFVHFGAEKVLEKRIVVDRGRLNDRQLRILSLMAEGATIADCARRLGMGRTGVRYHWDRMKSLTGLTHPSELTGAQVVLRD